MAIVIKVVKFGMVKGVQSIDAEPERDSFAMEWCRLG
jgi:hypothetical protein